MKKILLKFRNIFRRLFHLRQYYGWIFYTRTELSGEKKADYQTRFIDFSIRPGDKVLDIGSGGEPFSHATHIVDKFPGETHHRYNRLCTEGIPFAGADIEHLPFRDKEFDFVYCSHVLEHVKDPEQACEEIMRVGKRGYIETPTRLSDIIFNFTRKPDFHRWHISMVGNTLVFMEYQNYEQRDTEDYEYFLMAHSQWENSIRKAYRRNKDLFSNMFLWENRFNYYIFNKRGELVSRRNNPR
ncbi:class I SAM-dependent methyltransferase [bacterium]|nr:class I SAM-dependent methyltransferase [bacterium]